MTEVELRGGGEGLVVGISAPYPNEVQLPMYMMVFAGSAWDDPVCLFTLGVMIVEGF